MVDVATKTSTTRVAVAAGELQTTAEVVALVRANGMPKADVLATARVAGISGAKRTSELVPLCHQISLSSVTVQFEFTDTAITIEVRAKATGQTGVEMEALTGVAVAGLTLHDMVKAVDPAAVLSNVRLLSKEGGKRGYWVRDGGAQTSDVLTPRAWSAVVLVASTGSATGTRVDTTGPLLVKWLEEMGFSVRGPLVYSDEDIVAGFDDALSGSPMLIVSTGGTGVSPSDRTPEATAAILDYEIPGVAEALRHKGIGNTAYASISRGRAGVAGCTVVVNLPGSLGGVRDGMAVLEPILDHLLAQVSGGGMHDE
ncbi:bifunctional molybdenum cofactor biosynthesis protein MoaC/MoaB [Rhodococcus pyridinivorans]|uniref:bifunctional molybdenum cofactor biosynthesis protein MoaC/MoaB n=1 Tax=Rhodococcus pyridinivorans TaxID=103816 RepID=UPI0020C72885|nr:bifunctional molybdenum cofactor biosynthesis protein MoaC/MoaB [Rhodococcus pyridinivorans]